MMLSVSTYTKEYIDAFRAKVASQVSAYQGLVAAAAGGAAGASSPIKAAIEVFEPLYFGSLLLALDGHFVHRLRANEAFLAEIERKYAP